MKKINAGFAGFAGFTQDLTPFCTPFGGVSRLSESRKIFDSIVAKAGLRRLPVRNF
jgi:hypothetical protein